MVLAFLRQPPNADQNLVPVLNVNNPSSSHSLHFQCLEYLVIYTSPPSPEHTLSMDYHTAPQSSASHGQVYPQPDLDQAFNLHNGGSPPSHHHQRSKLMNIMQKDSAFQNSPVTICSLMLQETPLPPSASVLTRPRHPLMRQVIA